MKLSTIRVTNRDTCDLFVTITERRGDDRPVLWKSWTLREGETESIVCDVNTDGICYLDWSAERVGDRFVKSTGTQKVVAGGTLEVFGA